MLQKVYTPVSLFLEALLLLVVGILLFVNPEGTMVVLVSLLHVAVWVLAVVNLLRWAFMRNEKRPSLWQGLLLLALAIFLTVKNTFLSSSITVVFGVWSLINAFAKALYAVQLIKTKSRGVISTIIQCVIYVAFAILLFSDLLGGVISLGWIMGIYFLISAIFTLIDAVRELLGTDIGGKRVVQRIRLKPPVLLTAMMPMSLLRALNDPDEEKEVAQWTRQETDLKDARPNLEIFLHLGNKVAFGFGHVDIALDGKTYSFGCYDATSNRLGGVLSDGVLFQADRDGYLKYMLENAKRRLIGYGVVLSDEQKAALENKIAEYLKESTRWYPDEQKNPNQKKLERDAQAKFYKIGHGPFKTYNVLTTNCVAMANILAGSGGVDLMNPQGIVTPGTYMEFLDRQFLRKKSIIVSRTVYG